MPVHRRLVALLLGLFATTLQADPLFFEAEDFTRHGTGWQVNDNAQARRASGVQTLHGATGAVDSTASHPFTLTEGGRWRLWGRYMNHNTLRGPFDVAVMQGEKQLALHTFDRERVGQTPSWDYLWDVMEAELPAGDYTLVLRKHAQKNASGFTRHVDCFFLTRDPDRQPDHIPFGPQTWMRITLENRVEKPLYIHLFADRYRAPWYAHYAISLDGFESGLAPKRREALLGENTPGTGWVNISAAIYQDSGARLVLSPRHTYHQIAEHFKATIELATAPDAESVVRRFQADHRPASLNLMVPPNLLSQENIDRLRIDREMAMEIGTIADHFDWPTHGRKPETFPFFVSAHLSPDTLSRDILEREMQTLRHFGFNGIGSHRFFEEHGFHHKYIGNVGWFFQGTYSQPEFERMRQRAAALHPQQRAAGIQPHQIAYAMVMDEPGGQAAATLARDDASQQAFRQWLDSKRLSPADLLLESQDAVRLIPEAERDRFPALHYYTQQFRTVALGQFIGIQKKLLHEHWQADFPVNVNFSDGAVYFANFYGQGVDYFTLLRETDQNALWSEDWSNRASTYHCATYNVELMRAAAREGGQHLGHHLIAYAGRKGYDIRLKTISQVARGVKALKSYHYGPVWSGHDLSSWQQYPELWHDHASAIREIGAVENELLSAMPKAAKVAILYSSAADIWAQSAGDNAHGFERMHTWLALTHAQIPVDIVHETQVESGLLDDYQVCYLAGPHLTRAAAEKLAHWVRRGGTLVLSAGAGQKDEFNRPLSTLDDLLGFPRGELETLQKHANSGITLAGLRMQDTVTTGSGSLAVLASRQQLHPSPEGSTILARFGDQSPALVTTNAGQGRLVVYGFLPALDYIRQALIARNEAFQAEPDDAQAMARTDGVPGAEAILAMRPDQKSHNPWQYPAAIRELITAPVREAAVQLPIHCSEPLVEAIYMVSEEHPHVLIPLANYSLQPIDEMTLEIATDRPVHQVHSVHHGRLDFQQMAPDRLRVTLPLAATDFITLRR